MRKKIYNNSDHKDISNSYIKLSILFLDMNDSEKSKEYAVSSLQMNNRLKKSILEEHLEYNKG